MIVSTQRRLTHADLCRYEELLHGHRVHVGEVLRHKLLAVVPVAWRKEKDILTERKMPFVIWRKKLTEAIVLLEIDGELSDHDRVLDVRLNPLQSLDTLVAGVPYTKKIIWRKKSCLEFSTPKPFLFIV